MKRRQIIISAAGVAGLSGCIQTNVENTTAGGGPKANVEGGGQVLNDRTGIDEVVWRVVDAEKQKVALVIKYHDTAPGFVRLLNPSGTEAWRQDNPPGGKESQIPFSVPVGPQGDWIISSTTNGETTNLTLVINRDLNFASIDLNVDDLTVSALNTGTVPTVWESYVIYTGQHSESISVNELLLPDEVHEVTDTYPFDQYKNVRFHLFDGEDRYDQHRTDLI